MADSNIPNSSAESTADEVSPAPEHASSAGDGGNEGSSHANNSAAEVGRLPGWLAKFNPKVAAVAVGMLVFGAAGYAVGNHRPVAVSQNASVMLPGTRTDALGTAEGKSSRIGDSAMDVKPGSYYSNVLTADDPAQWPSISAGETRPGYASRVDEAARKEFTDRLLVLLGLPAKMNADGTVEWSECADGVCRSVGVMADADGNFNATVGNWPGACVVAEPGSPGIAVPEDKMMPMPAESAVAPSTGSAGGASGSSVDSQPMPAPSCPSAKPAPSEATVRSAAASWIGILGLSTDTASIVVERQEASYVTNAYIYQVIDGQRARIMATLTYADDTNLVSVYGNFAKLEKVADYRVVSAADAVLRTHDAQWSVAAQQVWEASSTYPVVWNAPDVWSPSAAPLQPNNLNGLIDDVVVTDPKPSLMQVFDVNGNSLWVPAYRVTDKATGKTSWDVVAIESSYFGN